MEKEALAGVFEGVCREFDVPLLCCRGYLSQSEMYAASKRIIAAAVENQTTYILHFGDHDPSGIDMSRDIESRLRIFSGYGDFDFQRIALNMAQVDQYTPPPNPAKETDSRFASYIKSYGESSWELDALEPSVLTELVANRITSLCDSDLWDEAVEKEQAERNKLFNMIKKSE